MRGASTVVAALAMLLAACGGGDPIPDGKIGDCARCHLPEFQGARAHVGQKPTTCAVCHSQSGWHPTILEHRWTLDGAHEKAKCFACHVGDPPKFQGLPHKCVDCHRKDYEHAKGHEGKPETCEDCHLTTSWKDRKKKSGRSKD